MTRRHESREACSVHSRRRADVPDPLVALAAPAWPMAPPILMRIGPSAVSSPRQKVARRISASNDPNDPTLSAWIEFPTGMENLSFSPLLAKRTG